MRLLFINPNTSQSVTAKIKAVAEGVAQPGTEIVAVTARRGVAYIATRAEAVIGAMSVLELLAEHRDQCDAAIIAAFGDPGLGAARELMPVPVIGLAEAGLLTACMLGRRYTIISFSKALGPWYRECVEYHGLEKRLAAIRLLDSPFHDIASVQDEKEHLLIKLCEQAAEQDGADVVVLAGAPLAGLAHRISERVPIPVVDCVCAAVCLAEALTIQKLQPSLVKGKGSANLEPALATFLAGD
jgi:Asp/Glu/hydantoin racemase